MGYLGVDISSKVEVLSSSEVLMRFIKHSYLLFALPIVMLIGTGSAHCDSLYDGFFVDVGAGYRSITASSSSAVTFRGNPNPYSISSSEPSNAIVVASAGYSFTLAPSYYLGVGVNVSPASGLAQQTSIVALNRTYSAAGIKPLYNYGVFLAPGMLFESGLVYAKVGSQTQVVNSNTGGDFKGYLMGLGYKQPIYESIYAFGEFDYSKYQSQTIARSMATSSGPINAFVTSTPQNVRLLLGLGYQF